MSESGADDELVIWLVGDAVVIVAVFSKKPETTACEVVETAVGWLLVCEIEKAAVAWVLACEIEQAPVALVVAEIEEAAVGWVAASEIGEAAVVVDWSVA